MLASLFSKPQPSLSVQARRLVAMRFLIYTGFQTSYFIGVIGTLTYADDASVVATSLAVLFMNVFVILGSFAGGAALDAWGPRRHFLLSIVGTLATGAAIIAFGSATGTVLAGAVLLGFVMGFAQPIATSYPAYLTDDPVELKDINSAIAMFSNVSIIVGPTLGGFLAAAALDFTLNATHINRCKLKTLKNAIDLAGILRSNHHIRNTVISIPVLQHAVQHTILL